MKRKPSLAALRRKLDKTFSLYIRRRDADANGMGDCVTCRRWAKLQCGHFIKRQHQAVRWDDRNAAGQCLACNHFHGGRQDEFAHHIIARYGEFIFHELMRLKRTTRKYSRSDLEEMIERYK